jgi:glutamate carboxypeptidase
MILVRGAGDISFVAEYVDGLDGLGTMGGGSHTPKNIWS